MKQTRILFMIAAILLINMSIGCAPEAGKKELKTKEANADGDKVGRYVVMNAKKPIRFVGDNSDPRSHEILIKVDTVTGNVWEWMEGLYAKEKMHAGKWNLMQDFKIPANFQDDK